VNGKALISGINLKEMNMSDMLDVIHFMFEEDSRYLSQEEVESVSATRTQVYETLYGVTYNYKVKARSKTNSTSTGVPDLDEVKPYVPPTEFDPESSNPFGSLLEAPLR
jgi:hypothetical protein